MKVEKQFEKRKKLIKKYKIHYEKGLFTNKIKNEPPWRNKVQNMKLFLTHHHLQTKLTSFSQNKVLKNSVNHQRL